MIRIIILLLILLQLLACKTQPKTTIPLWKGYNQDAMLSSLTEHENPRMRLQLVQSRVSDKNEIWDSIRDDLKDFGEDDYVRLYPLIYEQNIPEIQGAVKSGALTYEKLTQWYLYRIVKYENDSTTTLHTIIALNANAVEEARNKDRNYSGQEAGIYGMPILLKDNINTEGMPTTAGAVALSENNTGNAHIVDRLKSKGAIILGKVNLSEWAYYFCGGCPVGYSAIGGQTLNPYGRGIFETGGFSSGSGTSMAANYAVAAIGTETSGSILSPSGKNSIVGMKPTIGLLSRSGIVPISSTLDTPGPMTRSVTDNAILLAAMAGLDESDPATEGFERDKDYIGQLANASLSQKRLGVIKPFLEDSVYNATIEQLKLAGAEIIEFAPEDIQLEGFLTLLDADMKRDLPQYLQSQASPSVAVKTVQDVIDFNLIDTFTRAPYGQARLEGSTANRTTDTELEEVIAALNENGRLYFDKVMNARNLDAVLSIDNYSAGYAAVAKYPCLTVPMGYQSNGEPTNLTFIGKPQTEAELLQLGYAFEQLTKARKPPF